MEGGPSWEWVFGGLLSDTRHMEPSGFSSTSYNLQRNPIRREYWKSYRLQQVISGFFTLGNGKDAQYLHSNPNLI